MPYVRYFYMFAHSGVQHILCCAFVLFFFVLCSIAYVASFSRLSMFHCHLRFIAEILAKLMLGIEVKSKDQSLSANQFGIQICLL